jgi:hypothetical protein
MMGLHDVLRNTKQMLVPFKHYIKESEAEMVRVSSMAQVSSMVQAPPMVQAPSMAQAPQALPIVQATHTREPKFIMPKKYDGTQSKFRGFVQQVNLFLRLHPSRYPDDST